jgi:hypothetical protein
VAKFSSRNFLHCDVLNTLPTEQQLFVCCYRLCQHTDYVCETFIFFKIIFKNLYVTCNNIIYLARLSKYIIKITWKDMWCNEMVSEHS